MSILLRAAVLGGIAYFITRSLRGNSPMSRRSMGSGGASPLDELQPDESHVWPTSPSQPAPANAGPTS
jgi:hypothetical protein